MLLMMTFQPVEPSARNSSDGNEMLEGYRNLRPDHKAAVKLEVLCRGGMVGMIFP